MSKLKQVKGALDKHFGARTIVETTKKVRRDLETVTFYVVPHRIENPFSIEKIQRLMCSLVPNLESTGKVNFRWSNTETKDMLFLGSLWFDEEICTHEICTHTSFSDEYADLFPGITSGKTYNQKIVLTRRIYVLVFPSEPDVVRALDRKGEALILQKHLSPINIFGQVFEKLMTAKR